MTDSFKIGNDLQQGDGL